MKRVNAKNPILSPTQNRSKQTFEIILKATTYFIKKGGISNFTTNQIAEKAGININSFYHYFLNRDAAVLEVTNRFLKQDELHFEMIIDQAKKKKSKRDAFQFILNSMVDLMKGDPFLRKPLLVHLAGIVGRERVLARRKGFAEHLIPFMPDSKFQTEVKKRIAAQVVVHSFLSIFLSFFDTSFQENEREIFEKEIVGLLMTYTSD